MYYINRKKNPDILLTFSFWLKYGFRWLKEEKNFMILLLPFLI